jgi:hypothetical protein
LTLEDFLCKLVEEQTIRIENLTQELLDITKKYHGLLGYKDGKEVYEKSASVDMDRMLQSEDGQKSWAR